MEIPLMPASNLKDPSVYVKELKSIIPKVNKSNTTLSLELHKYADALYLDPFSDSMRCVDWRSKLAFLIIHHSQVMGYPPDDSLFLAAQLQALELGNIPAVHELYLSNMMAISGKYKDADINKLETKFDPISLAQTLDNAKKLMSRWEKDQEGLALAVKEFLGVPTGLDECIAFAAKQLLLREKTIQSTIEKASRQKLTNNNVQNLTCINFVVALTKKRFLVWAAMRELIRIKGMKDQNEIRLALGLFAAMFVRARFTNKLPDELLVHLQDYEPLSPAWFYFHMQLDKCMMAAVDLPCDSDLATQIQAQVFFENVLFARVILAVRGEAAEPYRTFLHVLAFDQRKSAVLMATSANSSCLTEKADLYMRLSTKQKLTATITRQFLSQNLQRSIESCANESGYITCRPLNFNELQMLSSTKMIQSSADDWFLDLGDNEPKKEKAKSNRKKVQKRKTAAAALRRIVLNPEDDSSSSLPTKIELEKEDNEDPVVPQQDIEEDLDDAVDDIGDYLAEHQAEVSEFKAMKKMKKYQFDALRDASKSLQVAESPNQLTTQKKISVVFFSTDDFLALHPEAAHVYQLNMYSELANEALITPKIKLQWVFSKDVVIGQGTFIFLCQVFHLVEGRSKLTFDDFLKAVDDLTKPTVGKHTFNKLSRTVFRFNHAFVINGETCLPPIGGVHREHRSSRFNYKQVKKFLMHGGAHPYFFQVLEGKPVKKLAGWTANSVDPTFHISPHMSLFKAIKSVGKTIRNVFRSSKTIKQCEEQALAKQAMVEEKINQQLTEFNAKFELSIAPTTTSRPLMTTIGTNGKSPLFQSKWTPRSRILSAINTKTPRKETIEELARVAELKLVSVQLKTFAKGKLDSHIFMGQSPKNSSRFYNVVAISRLKAVNEELVQLRALKLVSSLKKYMVKAFTVFSSSWAYLGYEEEPSHQAECYRILNAFNEHKVREDELMTIMLKYC